ncbi:MAG: DNA polymerase [Planctomycetota bacterium]
MEPSGKGKLGIIVVAEAPGKDEDEAGESLVGASGQFLARSLAKCGVNLDRDCTKINVVQCRPPKNRNPTADEIACCRPRVERQLAEARPKMIIALGTPAIAGMLDDAPFSPSATIMHGRMVPSPRRGCWVACGFHPAYYLHEDHRHDLRMDEFLAKAVKVLREHPYEDRRLDPSSYEIVEDFDRAADLLTGKFARDDPVALDYETTGLDPYRPGFKILTVGLAAKPEFGYCVPLDHPQARWAKPEYEGLIDLFCRWLSGPTPKVVQNRQYEELVSRVVLGTPIANVAHDTMLCEHVLDNRQGVCGQEFQEYVRYGSTHKIGVDRTNLISAPLDSVARYNALDARYCMLWRADQQAELDNDLRRGYDFFHEATELFVTMKQRGIRLDRAVLGELRASVSADLERNRAIGSSASLIEFQRRYHRRWEPAKNRDKQRLFFDQWGLTPPKLTKGGVKKEEGDDPDRWSVENCSTDAETVDDLLGQVKDDPERTAILQACRTNASLVKLGGYVQGFSELVDPSGFLHPSFLLHTAASYRSSSADPNFQNIPVRDPMLARLRKTIMPRHDWLMEIDFSGAEVRMYAALSGDPRLIADIDNDVDYHRFYAALLYEKPERSIVKDERDNGKSGFVFPEFYGSNARGVARSHPEWRPEVVERTERILWSNLRKLKEWQNRCSDYYRKHGYLPLKTGFRIALGNKGFLSYNQICNEPNQGTAFHRLLAVLMRLEAAMREASMTSVIVGQIHDSIVLDCADAEVAEIVSTADEIVRTPVWGWDGVVPWGAEFKIGRNLLEMAAL